MCVLFGLVVEIYLRLFTEIDGGGGRDKAAVYLFSASYCNNKSGGFRSGASSSNACSLPRGSVLCCYHGVKVPSCWGQQYVFQNLGTTHVYLVTFARSPRVVYASRLVVRFASCEVGCGCELAPIRGDVPSNVRLRSSFFKPSVHACAYCLLYAPACLPS